MGPGVTAGATLSLHPEALEDLRKSGLSDATIAEAGLYSPAPCDFARLLGGRLADRVRHVLVFPYDVIGYGGAWRGDDEFIRCKLFPAIATRTVAPSGTTSAAGRRPGSTFPCAPGPR
jgi:hypothetical protein